MNRFLQDMKRQNRTSAIVTVVIGLLLLLAPGGVVSTILKLIGWALLIVGGFMILSCMWNGHRSHQAVGDSLALVVIGLVVFLLGLWIVRNPGNVVSIAVTGVGLVLLLHAINDIGYAVDARKVMAQGWLSAAISGGVTLILAVMILLNPFGTAMSVIRIAGICLLIDGIGDLLMANRMRGYF